MVFFVVVVKYILHIHVSLNFLGIFYLIHIGKYIASAVMNISFETPGFWFVYNRAGYTLEITTYFAILCLFLPETRLLSNHPLYHRMK